MSVKNSLFRLRRARGCCLLLAVLLVLLVVAALIALGWGLGEAFAAEANAQGTPDPAQPEPEPALDLILVLDQSNSLWELGGAGSDPQMLRMEGARLFTTYLGVDGAAADYRLGVIFFGTQARWIAPLSSLKSLQGRQALLSILAQDPRPMGWTDVNAALALAYAELFEGPRAGAGHRTAVVLFTDGRPQTEALESPGDLEAYLVALRQQMQRFANQGTAVFTVMLTSAASQADRQTQELYWPFWMSLAESDSGVRFYRAGASQDLVDIYHDIAVQVHRGRSQGTVLNQAVSGSVEVSLEVPEGWMRANFVVSKTDPALEVSIRRPDGRLLTPGDPDVLRAGEPQASRHEVWSVESPLPGRWVVKARGQGMVTVWLDYQPSPPTPVPTPTLEPAQTPTTRPVSSPTSRPAATPTAPLRPTAAFTSTATPVPAVSPKAGGLPPAGGSVEAVVGSPGRSRWPWIGAGCLLLLAGGARVLACRGRNRRRPTVEGSLRLVEGPAGEPPHKSWELGPLGRASVALGSATGCEIHLAHDPTLPTHAAAIRTGRDGQGRPAPVLDNLGGSASVEVNGKPVVARHLLGDNDIIQIGSYRLRYNNLRLRLRAMNWQPPQHRGAPSDR